MTHLRVLDPVQAEQLYREARAGGSAKLGGAPSWASAQLLAAGEVPVFVDRFCGIIVVIILE